MNNFEYEREIDIIDMLKDCLKKWWLIIAMAIAGACVGGTIALYINDDKINDEEIIEEEFGDKEKSLCDTYIEVREQLKHVNITNIETNEELDYYYSLKKKLINDYDSFSDKQKEYIFSESVADNIVADNNITDIEDGYYSRNTFAMVIMGGGAGVVAATMVICMMYILLGTIKTQGDMLLYGLKDYYHKDEDYMKSLVGNLGRNQKVRKIGIIGEKNMLIKLIWNIYLVMKCHCVILAIHLYLRRLYEISLI